MRFAGYLGLVLFIAGAFLEVVLPSRGRMAPSSPLRDQAAVVMAVGYGLMFLRALHLAVFGERLRARWLGFLSALTLELAFVVAFIGIALLTSTPMTTATG